MEIRVAKEFDENYMQLPERIKVKFEKQERIFRNNPFHPSLHTEKISPKWREVWSFRIDKSYRALFMFLERDSIILLNIGPHDWIYRGF